MPHKLLLADDSVTIQRVIELTFADEDISVATVSDGEQAIARIDAEPPDIVLADVGMPGKDGYEVAAHVKQTPALAHIPVVLLTGAFEPVDEARARSIGCDGVLAKPFEPQQVIGRVKELLNRGSAPAGADAPAKPTATWPPPHAAAPAQPAPEERAAALDQYFDRLDQAFATLPATEAAPHAASNSLSAADEMEWFGDHADAPRAASDRPLSYASPQAEFTPARTTPAQGNGDGAGAPAVVPAPAGHGAQLPPLADAFAALLAAEQAAGRPIAAPVWPASSTAAVTDDLVEQLTARVLERLADRATVAETLASVAERLVREEIERIKASIK